ncbi:MAG: transcription-repair coupling factor [Bacteroidetes bacterium]|nr:MAG: transcription-repair coupling factor [Bacteroidota bacterium]REK04955.1 MAG: transcription-repair coupling factor [Bacteroidota bacterium]REK36541.1 MAG: transcription-repair coupling factor [Bacteroidota bacterium]REK50907.1 MAG: transcription-repair coupling factor [Bacteroidota bacterium]
MEKSELPGLYASRPKLISLSSRVSEPHPHNSRLIGLSGSAASVVAGAVYLGINSSMLFIMNDREEASYFLNDLENIFGDSQCFLFPSSYRKSFHTEEQDKAGVLARAEVLSRINKNIRTAIVSYPEAIAEKVVTRQNLVQNTIEMRVGEGVSIEFITEFLLHHEFENVDFVAQAGEFSVRGGIVDIFSFANELPYRVEFFGDKVESIRTFDPENQLSVQAMNHVTIMPNIQSGLIRESRSSIFDFIPSSTPVWIKNLRGMMTFLESNIQKVDAVNETGATAINQTYDSPSETLSKLSARNLTEFGMSSFFDDAVVFEFDTSPQPSFNKNFDLLLSNLRKNKEEGIKNVILSDSARQMERLYAIFEDLAKKNSSGRGPEFSTLNFALHEGYIDHELKIAFYTDHQIFDRYHRFRLKKNYSRSEALTLRELTSLKPGDFVTHIDHGIGRFAGLEILEVDGKPQEAIRLVYKDNDILYVSIHSLHRIARYTGKDGAAPALHKLGSNTWSNLKQKTKKKVKDIAKDLIALYAKRKSAKGFAFSKDTYLQNELEASFIYEDTPDQEKSTRDVKADMEKQYPMDRLICGDVGFGKTEIAIRAAFKAVTDGKQAAVLVPTTILALQHYNTFKDRLKEFPCKVDYINRFKSTAKQKDTLKQLEEGKIDIIIGTHRLLGKDIKFKDLGLMIVDEEQKFGVAAKEKLKALRVNVDTLTLTATPIPRTLQFSLMGARDLSIINTPPPNRYPVNTEVHQFNEKVIQSAIEYELSRGGQVFFVHNRVQDIHEIADFIAKLVPGAKIGIGHGQMDGERLEEVLLEFIDGNYDILVATTIIESGLDIPNANTILINQAQNFGLSDLHQMRGRVGRTNKKAFCYLLTPPATVLTSEARQRLRAIEEFSDLGSGFNVAMRDLDIRGAGNLLGGEQSGFISEIGFEMYHKILDEAIHELKENEFPELFKEELAGRKFVNDCQIDTDLEILLPAEYVNSVTERLALYKELDNLENEKNLLEFESKLQDRFGDLPPQAKELMNTIRLRWLAEKLGFEKIMLKNKRFFGYFVGNPTSPFYQSEIFTRLLKYVQVNAAKCRLRQDKNKLSLVMQNIPSVDKANETLKEILGE